MHIAGLLFGARDRGVFVQAGTRGLEEARDALGGTLSLHFCDAIDEVSRTATLEAIAREGADLIVLHGGQGEAPLAAVAPTRPAQHFALSQGHLVLPNVACYEVMLEQPAFLAGALAALSSRSGIVAHLSGEQVGPGLRGFAAFDAGARHAVPGIQVLSHFCGHQHDPHLAALSAQAHAAAGADVLFTMLGQGRSGAIDMCRESGMKQIGDVVDWCAIEPDVFIASAIADSAWCTRQAVIDLHEGRITFGERRSAGLEQPAVCRLAMHPAVPAEVRRRIGLLQAAAGA